MRRFLVEYTPEWRPAPLSFWVHMPTDGRPWFRSGAFEPPLPRVVPGRGYPRYRVEVDGFTFEFASLAEIDACIATLSRKHLPSTDEETRARGTGPGSHWLNKLPASTKSWRYRSRAVACLREARDAFERNPGGA